MKKFDVIIFDADDTLFDFQKSERYSLEKTFKDFKIVYKNEIIEEFNTLNKFLWEQYNKGDITKDDLLIVRFDVLFKKYKINCNSKEFNDKYLLNLSENSFLMEDAEKVCNLLSRDFKLIIATNAASKVAYRKIQKSNINKYISNIFVSDDIGCPKPKLEFFEYILNYLNGIKRHRIIMVGDSLTSDIKGGNTANIPTCWINNFGIKNMTDITPTYEINSLKELLPIVGCKYKL